jgi:hypothetical protein
MIHTRSVFARGPWGALRAAFAVLLVGATAGCAWLPIRHTGNPVSPIDSASDTLAAVTAARDTVAPGPPPPIGTEPVTEHSADWREGSAPTHKDHPGGAPPPVPGASVPDSTGKEPLSVSVALSDAEKSQLRTACLGDLAAAESMLSSAASRSGGREADREKLETARGFVTEARSALDKGDVRAAATLAHKARVLAETITTP